jgi:hypothetical protein
MKKLIYISGIACANLMMLGCMFKIFHWPGANIMLVAAVFLFSFFFLPSALISSYLGQAHKQFRWLHIATFLVFAIGMMGVLFKVLHWPGATVFLQVGIPLPFVVFLLVYIYETRLAKRSEDMNFLGVMFGLTFLAVFSVLLAMR